MLTICRLFKKNTEEALSKRVGLSLLALLIVFGGSAFGAIWYPAVPTPQSTDNSSTNWSFELGSGVGNAPLMWNSVGTFVVIGGGSTSQAADPTPLSFDWVAITAGGGIAAYIREGTNSLAGAIYGATASIIRDTGASWTLEIWEGGTPTPTGTPSSGTLLAARTESLPTTTGNPGQGAWPAFGVESTTPATGGMSVWVRLMATGASIGADSVLGVETPADGGGGGVPEPFTMGLVGSGFLGLALFRRIRR
jgi:hypothetical protein